MGFYLNERNQTSTNQRVSNSKSEPYTNRYPHAVVCCGLIEICKQDCITVIDELPNSTGVNHLHLAMVSSFIALRNPTPTSSEKATKDVIKAVKMITIHTTNSWYKMSE
jgi:hypothetical protein